MNPGTLQLTERWVNALLVLVSSGLVTAVLNWWFYRHRSDAETEKLRAEARQTEVETARNLIDELNEARQRMQDERDDLRTRVERLEADAVNLKEQISLALERIGELEGEIKLALARIGELEGEVVEWKKKYHALLERYNRLIKWIRGQGLIPPIELESTLTTLTE